jgi:hypothetical protein
MPIRTYLEDHSAFSPEEIKVMSKALDEACAALQVAGQMKDRDATALRDRVVEAMRSL